MPRYGKHTSITHNKRRREFRVIPAREGAATDGAGSGNDSPATDELEQQCREHPDDHHSDK
jgi:hypothetical protein